VVARRTDRAVRDALDRRRGPARPRGSRIPPAGRDRAPAWRACPAQAPRRIAVRAGLSLITRAI